MKRRLFSILASLSFLAWILLLTVWVRSKDGADKIWFSFHGRLIAITCDPSSLLVAVVNPWTTAESTRWIRSHANEGHTIPHELIFEGSWATGAVQKADYPGIKFAAYTGLQAYFTPSDSSLPIPNDGAKPDWQKVFPNYTVSILGINWVIMLLIPMILPLSWVIMADRRQRRRVYRLRNHLCISCGYDVRSSTDRCPECGTVIALPAPSPLGRGLG